MLDYSGASPERHLAVGAPPERYQTAFSENLTKMATVLNSKIGCPSDGHWLGEQSYGHPHPWHLWPGEARLPSASS